MATFHAITAAEMAAFLEPQGFTKMTLPGTIEIVYGKRVDNARFKLSLRVYTGIVSDTSREVGEDAIRVTLFMFNPQTKQPVKLGGSKRVHRVKGWAKNLQDRINNWQEYLGEPCSCGYPMVVREGKNGKFLGCSNYPNCRLTKSVT